MPLVRSQNIQFRGFVDYGLVYLNEVQAEALKNVSIQAEDVLLNITGASIGRVCLAPSRMVGARVNQHVAIIRSIKNSIHPKFLASYLSSPQIQSKIHSEEQGVTRQALTKEWILNLEVPTPPLAEQHRIVAKLDSILPRVEKVRERLEKIPALVKRFRQSVLTAAVTGKLTERWREKNPEAGNEWITIDQADFTEDERIPSWISIRADKCCKKVQSGGTPKGSQFSSDGGVPFLKVYNIVDQVINFDYKPQFVSQDIHASELRKSIAFPGDVLMNIVGPPLGKVAIVPEYHHEWNINQAITLFRPNEYLDNHFLYFALREGSPYSEILEETRGSAGQTNISLSQCREMKFRLPPFSEQKEIVRQVEKLFALADKLEAHYHRAMARVEKFPQAILAKAFRGELVPQDPKDEPAENLLERIRQERAGLETVGRARKKPSVKPKRVKAKAMA